MEMVTLRSMKSFMVSGYIVETRYEIRQYYEFSNVFLTREEDPNGNNYLIAYGYSEASFEIQWEFPSNDIVGISPIKPESSNEEGVLTKVNYSGNNKELKEKELLQVYAGEFHYVLDGNTGEIFSKVESR